MWPPRLLVGRALLSPEATPLGSAIVIARAKVVRFCHPESSHLAPSSARHRSPIVLAFCYRTLSRPRSRCGLASFPLAPACFRRARSRFRPRLRYSSPPAPPTGRAAAGAPFASRCASLLLRSPFALGRGLLRPPAR